MTQFLHTFTHPRVIGQVVMDISDTSFVADFYCPLARLVIELDGSQHYTEQVLADVADFLPSGLAAEQDTDCAVNGGLQEGVANQGHDVGVEGLDVLNTPDRSGNIGKNLFGTNVHGNKIEKNNFGDYAMNALGNAAVYNLGVAPTKNTVKETEVKFTV